jgi:hypothetical protein
MMLYHNQTGGPITVIPLVNKWSSLIRRCGYNRMKQVGDPASKTSTIKSSGLKFPDQHTRP